MKDNVIDAQQELYDKKAPDYLKHHGDQYSQAYREKFIRRPLFNINFDLHGKKILDAMAAFGPETGFLIERGADVIGLDISPANARLYEERWNRQCLVASIHKTGLPDSFFDVVYICGGLHHILPLLGATLQEIHRILKPSGYFYFMEPNKDTWLNELRVHWYKLDSRFGDNEEAISYVKQLKHFLQLGFEEILFEAGGNIAYILIVQSLIVGIPLSVKRLIYRPLFAIEQLLAKFPLVPKLYFLGAWRKISSN